MSARQGNLSINSENMLPIIKKWLYSDHDIFVREQISNACDAITKLKKLQGIGEYRPEEEPVYEISVEFDPEEKTLTFVDTGIGMTAEEVEEYITQIAFSGATEFIEKYQGSAEGEQIIGHFGLGFYSAFMVADEVHIDTLSYKDGAESVHWESDGQSTYTIEEGDKDTIGTEITLFLNDDCYEFCNEYRLREVIEKYCSFMPYPIYLTDISDAGAKKRADEIKKIEEENAKAIQEAQAKGEEMPALKDLPVPEAINDTNPLWMRKPSEVTDEEYKEFYRKVFRDYKEPLFWLHRNTDY
ncbi:MAG: ATP-binding protein, partial [Lachnospiraceae bacterium]|nr:ATP-binding protein [Candidatus Equihabitans merdae]